MRGKNIDLQPALSDAAFISYPRAEIEEAARKMEAIFAELWPVTYRAFLGNRKVAP